MRLLGPSRREEFKPFILCSKCMGNIMDCSCWGDPDTPKWISERRSQFPEKPVKVTLLTEEQAIEKLTGPRPSNPVYRSDSRMRFDFNGKTYAIEFKRTLNKVERLDETGQTIVIQKRYPDTTVNILEFDLTTVDEKGKPVSKVFQTATVGAWNKEPNFSKETGRLRAIHNVMRTLPKEMKPLVWYAYQNRKGRVSINPPGTPIPVVVQPTPAVLEGEVVSSEPMIVS